MDEKQQIYTEILVLRSQQGEKEAFGLLVELWQKPLISFALRYLEQESEALDVVQETWISVIKKLNKLQNPSLFVSWLFRVLTNKCIDRIRKKQNEENLMKNTNLDSETPEISTENDFLEQTIQELSDEQKTLIILRFGQGLQVSRIVKYC
jgi:RNA polymerase sigma-70 factor (ECF subfamily)